MFAAYHKDRMVTEVSEEVTEAQLQRQEAYRQQCEEAFAERGMSLPGLPSPLYDQDRIDLLVGRLARFEAEQDNIELLMENDRAELARLRVR